MLLQKKKCNTVYVTNLLHNPCSISFRFNKTMQNKGLPKYQFNLYSITPIHSCWLQIESIQSNFRVQ